MQDGAGDEAYRPAAYEVKVLGEDSKLRRLTSGSGRTFRSPAIADVVAVRPLLEPTAGRSIIHVELSLEGTRLR